MGPLQTSNNNPFDVIAFIDGDRAHTAWAKVLSNPSKPIPVRGMMILAGISLSNRLPQNGAHTFLLYLPPLKGRQRYRLARRRCLDIEGLGRRRHATGRGGRGR